MTGPRGVWGSIVALALLALAGCATPQGPATREEMLARGAKRLGQVELNTLLPGARIVKTGNTGIPVVWTNRENGTLTAIPERVALAAWIGRGRWWLTPNGAYCTEIDWQADARSEGIRRICWHVYRLDEVYYGVQADGRSTPVDHFSIRPASAQRGPALTGPP